MDGHVPTEEEILKMLADFENERKKNEAMDEQYASLLQRFEELKSSSQTKHQIAEDDDEAEPPIHVDEGGEAEPNDNIQHQITDLKESIKNLTIDVNAKFNALTAMLTAQPRDGPPRLLPVVPGKPKDWKGKWDGNIERVVKCKIDKTIFVADPTINGTKKYKSAFDYPVTNGVIILPCIGVSAVKGLGTDYCTVAHVIAKALELNDRHDFYLWLKKTTDILIRQQGFQELVSYISIYKRATNFRTVADDPDWQFEHGFDDEQPTAGGF